MNIVGRVITTQAVASAAQFVPASEPGSSKGLRRLETVLQAVALVEKFVPARELGSSKDPRRSESIGGEIRACQGTRVG